MKIVQWSVVCTLDAIFAHVLNPQKMHLTYCLGYLLVKKRENYSNSPIVQVIFMIKLYNSCLLQNNKLSSRPSWKDFHFFHFLLLRFHWKNEKWGKWRCKGNLGSIFFSFRIKPIFDRLLKETVSLLFLALCGKCKYIIFQKLNKA